MNNSISFFWKGNGKDAFTKCRAPASQRAARTNKEIVWAENVMRMMPSLLTLILLMAVANKKLSGQSATTQKHLPSIIPLPVEAVFTQQQFPFTAGSSVTCKDSSLLGAATLLNFYRAAAGGKCCTVTNNSAATGFIVLAIDSNAVKQTNGYRLRVTDHIIELTGHDAGGVIYGVQTLRQLFVVQGSTLVVPGCTIHDYPRFSYRGMGLDVSRHMFPVNFIKKYIDLLALYKFNVFHWHLTDDQGWRIEIKKYPFLQTIAAWRSETLIGHKKELPHRFDGKRYGGYYTQEEIKDIVRYAQQRNISIIPEIEMPGHALAALSAYPALGCTGGPYQAATFWGVFDDVYCAGNDSTFTFLQGVLDEVIQLFPSGYIHIGGDECPKTKWKQCPKCQKRMMDLHLKDEHALQGYFIKRIEQYINSRGKTIIGWDEILEGGLAPNATVMSWRGETGGIAAAMQHHDVVMTPESNLYFDYYQSLNRNEPMAAAGYTPVQKVYGYEPLPPGADTAAATYIKGLEGQAFSEYFYSPQQAEYMIFPRALAVAEIGWTPAPQRNYTNFLQRLRQQTPLLEKSAISFANNYDEVYFAEKIGSKKVWVTLQSSLPHATIHYTTNGTMPGAGSNLYKDSIAITRTCQLQARVFDANQRPVGRVFQQRFTIHKGIGALVSLKNTATEKYNEGPQTLVNGINGNTRYNDGQWTGFSGDNLEAIIDLGRQQTIRKITLHILNYHWQRMWAPTLLTVAVSKNQFHFTTVFHQNKFPVNGINTIIAALPAGKYRYIKIIGVNKGTIPKGSYGAGSKALLMTDEMIID